MTSKLFELSIICLLTCMLPALTGCNSKPDNSTKEQADLERRVIPIPLSGEVSKKYSELSGLAWYKDNLILLPQYPSKFKEDDTAAVFKISQNELLKIITNQSKLPIEPAKIKFVHNGLEKYDNHGSGYESIAFADNKVYLTIEYVEEKSTSGYIVSGNIDSGADRIVMNPETLSKIDLPAKIYNLSDEAAAIYKNKIYTFYEANGKNVNPNPFVNVFDLDLNFIKKLKFPNIEYRITDVTAVDDEGKFWAVNYFWPGDYKYLNPAEDNYQKKFSVVNHADSSAVERIIELQILDDEIIKTGTPPVWLKLAPGTDGRNWEGIVRFENKGFILATDKFPGTILAFVPYEKDTKQ